MSLVTRPKTSADHAGDLAASLMQPTQCVQTKTADIPVSLLESAALLGIAAAELGE